MKKQSSICGQRPGSVTSVDNQPSTNPGASGDTGFDALLRSAKVKVPLPGAFQAEVWRRIAVTQESTLRARLSRMLESLLGTVARPLAASAVMLTMISAGLWFGSSREVPVRDAKLAYVQSVSPFAHQHGGEAR